MGLVHVVLFVSHVFPPDEGLVEHVLAPNPPQQMHDTNDHGY